MEPFVTIANGHWEIHFNQWMVQFPASGRGLKTFFRKNKIREVMCSSSVDFPREESTLTAKQAEKILNNALSW